MTTQQPEALAQECADYATSLRSGANVANLKGRAPSVSFLRAADLFERAASRITELESQLAQRFDAADMATAAAQGFMDGVASVAASAESEPVATIKSWTNGSYWRNYNVVFHRDDLPVGTDLYTHPSPPEGMAGWQPIETAPKDGSYLLLWEQYSHPPFVGYWSGGRWSVSHEHVDAEGGWDGANVVDALSMPITHWMPLPPAPGPADGESNE